MTVASTCRALLGVLKPGGTPTAIVVVPPLDGLKIAFNDIVDEPKASGLLSMVLTVVSELVTGTSGKTPGRTG